MEKEVKPIPEGYHTITPYLVVEDTGKAIDFYKRAFGAKEIYGNYTPDGKSIIHAEIKIGDSVLMISDEFLQGKCRSSKSIGGTAVMIHLYSEDVDNLFNQAIAAGATVVIP